MKHKGDLLFRNWQSVIDQLADILPADATVAVFPNTSIQILKREEAVAVGA